MPRTSSRSAVGGGSGSVSSAGRSSSSASGRGSSRSSHSSRTSSGTTPSGGASASTGRELAPVPETTSFIDGASCSTGSLRSLSQRDRQLMVATRRSSRQSTGPASGARTADVAFLVDCTASMNPFAKAAAETVSQVLDTIAVECGGVACRAAIVGYRDHCEAEDQRYDILPFTSDISAVRDKMAALASSGCFGGGDGPEDVHGGLNEALVLDWASDARVIFHIADAPCHGAQFHDGLTDHHPDGFQGWEGEGLIPEQMTAESLLADLVGEQISYCFLRITPHTERMISAFRDIYRRAASGTPCHFSIAKLGTAPDSRDTAAWKEFTARFASLLRGSLRESICSARPPPGGGSGKMVRFSDRNSATSARSSASKACSMPLGSKPRLALREC